METLQHSGVLGMHWGVRRSSTGHSSAGHSSKKKVSNKPEPPKKRNVKDFSDQELSDLLRRLNNERQYNDLMASQTPKSGSAKAKEFVKAVVEKSGKEVASKVVTYALGKAINKMLNDTVISVGKDASKKKDDN